jgi:hypothetical protein
MAKVQQLVLPLRSGKGKAADDLVLVMMRSGAFVSCSFFAKSLKAKE